MLAGGLAAVICAVVLDERDLLRVGVFAALLPVIALFVTASRKVRLSAAHQVLPLRLQPGVTGQATLTVTNTGNARSSTLELAEPATPDLADGVHCLIPPLAPGRSAATTYRIHAERRGRFLLGPPQVRISDPFGLWEDHRTLPARSEVLVVPAVVPLSGMPISTGVRSAAMDRAAVGATGGEPDVGIRVYRNGDDIRTIHWRASARSEELMVRLEEPVSHGGATILLDVRADAHAGRGAHSSLETAVSLAASVSLHLLAADHQLRLLTSTGALLASGRDIADDVLANLAVVQADDAPALRPLSLTRSGMIVAVLGNLAAADARMLVASRGRSTSAVALLLDTAAWPEGHSSGAYRVAAATRAGARPDEHGDASAVLRAAGWRVVSVRPGEDLAEVWRQACAGSVAFRHGMDLPSPRPAMAGSER